MAPVRLTVSPSLMRAVVAEDHDADVVGFEVERHAANAAGKLDHFAGLDVVEAVDAGDAVADRQHLADFGDLGLLAEILDLLLQDRGDLCGPDFHTCLFPYSAFVVRAAVTPAARRKTGRRMIPRPAHRSAGSLQHDFQVHEFRPQRGIEHAAADLDHQAAEQRGVNLGVEPHVLAVGRLERVLERGELLVVERHRRLHFGHHLAAVKRELLAEAS